MVNGQISHCNVNFFLCQLAHFPLLGGRSWVQSIEQFVPSQAVSKQIQGWSHTVDLNSNCFLVKFIWIYVLARIEEHYASKMSYHLFLTSGVSTPQGLALSRALFTSPWICRTRNQRLWASRCCICETSQHSHSTVTICGIVLSSCYQVAEPSLAVFPGTLAGSWIRNGATKTGIPALPGTAPS